MHRVVYVIRSGQTTCYKVGITNSVNDRLKALQSGNPERLTASFVISPLGSENDAQEIETKLHRLLSGRKIHGEWFKFDQALTLDAVLNWLDEIKLAIPRVQDTTLHVEFTNSSKPPEKFKVLARHGWVAGAPITESVKIHQPAGAPSARRFTATIRGFRNWKIYQGESFNGVVNFVITTVRQIRDRIDAGDDTVFDEPNDFATAAIAQANLKVFSD